MNKLVDTKVVTQKVTFNVPHVLISYSENNGFPVMTLRQGGSRQVEATITTDWYDAPVEEKPFTIKAKNKLNFGDLRLDVLNDEITGIAPSCPTAYEYLSKVGQTVMIGFGCDLRSGDSGKDVYRVVRSSIVLP